MLNKIYHKDGTWRIVTSNVIHDQLAVLYIVINRIFDFEQKNCFEPPLIRVHSICYKPNISRKVHAGLLYVGLFIMSSPMSTLCKMNLRDLTKNSFDHPKNTVNSICSSQISQVWYMLDWYKLGYLWSARRSLHCE